MNKLEKRYAENLTMKKLAGEIEDWRYNELRFKVAGGGPGIRDAWYKPDFLVVRKYPLNPVKDDWMKVFELHETKGFWRAPARIRIKVCAERYPWFKFVAVQWDRNAGWQFEEFS